MSIKAEIIADSVNSFGCRLTTFVLEFPRWILAEVNTHRVFSRNVASSRAIPIEKMIQMVESKPATPVFWGKNQAGMQSKEELRGDNLELAKKAWLEARDRAVESAKVLSEVGLHKQYVNRTIENFMYVRAILSGTEFDNFYKLRAHPDAQPEFQALAYKMQEEHQKSVPKLLENGDWHIPFGDNIDEERIKKQFDISDEYQIEEIKRKIAVARCARVSYFNYEGKDDYIADVKLCDRLFKSEPKHLSPTEHVAQNVNDSCFHANFRGFVQFRKYIE